MAQTRKSVIDMLQTKMLVTEFCFNTRIRARNMSMLPSNIK